MNRKGMTLFQVVIFVIVICIVGFIATRLMSADFNDDLAGFQKERGEILSRISQYEQVIQNNKYRLAQLDALIEYAQSQIVIEKPQEKPKENKKLEDKARKAAEKTNKELAGEIKTLTTISGDMKPDKK